MDSVDKHMTVACLSGAAAGILFADGFICTPLVLGIVAAGSAVLAIRAGRRDTHEE